MNKTFRDIFNEAWLFEMPRNTGIAGHSPYDDLLSAVTANLEDGIKPSTANDLTFLYIDDQDIYCWFGDFEIIANLTKFKKGLAINVVGKKPNATSYASDFYQQILQSTGSLLFSGDILSSQGFGIWANLLASGKSLMVYDPLNTNMYKKLNSIEELNQFYGSTVDYEKYRYVLSENVNVLLANFDLMRTYKLTFNLE